MVYSLVKELNNNDIEIYHNKVKCYGNNYPLDILMFLINEGRHTEHDLDLMKFAFKNK